MKKFFPYNFLNKSAIEKIKEKISEIEKETVGEIVVSIKLKRSFWEKKKSLFELAQKEFVKARIAETSNSTGILIFIVLNEKQFYILPDKNIINIAEKDFWQKIADEMSSKFKTQNFEAGLIECIEKIGKLLKENFPVSSVDKNELSDEVRIN